MVGAALVALAAPAGRSGTVAMPAGASAAAVEAAAMHGVAAAPVGDHFRKEHPGAYLADGVHPSEVGHGWMAEAVLAILDAV